MRCRFSLVVVTLVLRQFVVLEILYFCRSFGCLHALEFVTFTRFMRDSEAAIQETRVRKPGFRKTGDSRNCPIKDIAFTRIQETAIQETT